MRMRRPFLAPVLLLPLMAATPAFAQRSEGPSPLRGDSAVRTAPVARRTLAPIVFEAEPRSFQVVRVPIPAALSGAEGVAYEVEPAGAFMVIGARRGTVNRNPARADLLITVRIPADVLAGPHMAAHAIFRLGNTEIEVPIETRVMPIYRLRLEAETTVKHANVGERVEVSALVHNDGNATDTVRIHFELPAQWQQTARDTVVVLPSGADARRLVRVLIPKQSSTGSFFIRAVASSRAGRTSKTTTLSVGSRPPDVAPPGPTAHIAMGAVGVENGGSVAVGQVALSGPLTNSIQIDGRITTRPAVNSAAILGLSRVGAYVTEPHLTARSDTWRLGLGSTMANMNPVMGVNAGGRGLSFSLDDQKHMVNVTAARPAADWSDAAEGSLLSANYARRMRLATVGGTFSRLRDSGVSRQQLTAAGVHAISAPAQPVGIEGALAYRDYGDGDGMGWIVGMRGELPSTRAQLRYVHAPGGSRAYARAESELTANTATRLGDRVEVATSMLRAKNTDSWVKQAQSSVYSLTSSYRFSGQNTIRTELRSSNFEFAGTPISFDNGELHFGIGASLRFSGTAYSTDVGVDRLTRGVQTPEVAAEDVGGRLSWRLRASRPAFSGVAEIEGLYERSDRGTGFVPEQHSISARLERARVPGLPPELSLGTEASFTRWTGIRSFGSWRGAANYQFTRATEISASVEHNPLIYSGSGNTPVIFAVRIERSFGLPRMNVGRAAGIVFQDYNGNGRRDSDEPGMPNIRVRRGYAHAMTDSEGRFRFWEEGRGPTVVEPSTIPYGWIVNGAASDGDIALVPTTRVEVTLQLGLAERLRNVDISQIAVTARDEGGRIWFARRTANDAALFESLPVGIYELAVDASAITEPLRIEGPAVLRATREPVKRMTLTLVGRPLRFKQQQSSP